MEPGVLGQTLLPHIFLAGDLSPPPILYLEDGAWRHEARLEKKSRDRGRQFEPIVMLGTESVAEG